MQLGYSQWEVNGTKLSNSNSESHNYKPYISARLDGGAYISWISSNANSNTVYLSSIDSNGSVSEDWPQHGLMISEGGDFYAPYIITSEDNSVIIAWYGTPLNGNFEHIYIQKYSKRGKALWNDGEPIQVNKSSKNNNKYPVLVSDRNKGVCITWTRYDMESSASSLDIMLQCLDSTGAVYPNWVKGGIEVAAEESVREQYPRIALMNNGTGIYVMYSEGGIGNIKLKITLFDLLTGTRAEGWDESGYIIGKGPYVEPNILKNQFLFCDEEDNAIAFWVEWRYTDNGEVYMQRITPEQNILLQANGKRIGGNSLKGIGYLEVVKNEDSDYLLAFNDYSKEYDIDALKVSADGTKIWENTSLTTNGISAYPKPISDGNKGMYVFYKYLHSSSNYLYAIAIDSTGNIYNNWTIPGSSFGAIDNFNGFFPNYDFYPTYVGQNKAIVAWTKPVGGLFEIFTCNLWSNGVNCTDSITNIKESNEIDKILVFPNPASNYITVKLETEHDNIFTIYNLFGQIVLETLISEKYNQVDVLHFPNGLYSYTLYNNFTNAFINGKLIVFRE